MTRNLIFLALVVSLAVATSVWSAPPDFESLRKAADQSAAGERSGFKLLMAHVTASHAEGTLQIHDSEFHYFGPVEKLAYEIPGVTTRVGELPMLRVLVRPVNGDARPTIETFPYKLPLDKAAWPMTDWRYPFCDFARRLQLGGALGGVRVPAAAGGVLHQNGPARQVDVVDGGRAEARRSGVGRRAGRDAAARAGVHLHRCAHR